MAYMGRGERPSIGQDNDNVYIHSHRYRRSYYHIISYSTYMKIEMIVTFIILIVGIIAFITTYQSAVIDPIENIKKQFINTHLILIGALLAITLITNFISKTEATLINKKVSNYCNHIYNNNDNIFRNKIKLRYNIHQRKIWAIIYRRNK